jgi:hypothetical protein
MNVRELQTGEIWLNHPEENRNFRNNQFRKINKQNDFKTNKFNVSVILIRNKLIMNITRIMISVKKEKAREMNLKQMMNNILIITITICTEESSIQISISIMQVLILSSRVIMFNIDPNFLQRSSDESSHEGHIQDENKGKNKLSINSMINDKVFVLL